MIPNSSPWRVRPGIIGVLTLCLSLTGCLAAQYDFGGVGFRIIPAGVPPYPAQQAFFDETEFPGAKDSSSPWLRDPMPLAARDLDLDPLESSSNFSQTLPPASTPASTTQALPK